MKKRKSPTINKVVKQPLKKAKLCGNSDGNETPKKSKRILAVLKRKDLVDNNFLSKKLLIHDVKVSDYPLMFSFI